MAFISVVICTYNRAQLLHDALETVCNQTLSPAEYEVIVVDNNSTDGTDDLVNIFIERYTNVRYCLERNQGLSHARNRGLQEAHGEYLGYIDDDCRVPFFWLKTAGEIIEKISPQMFGGPSYALYDGTKPSWFKDSYACRIISDTARPLEQREYIRGFNMFFQKTVLERLGGFDVSLGMNGKRIAYGEDIAIQTLIRRKLPHAVIYFHPRLHVNHLVRVEKLKLKWLVRAFFAKGRYVYLISQDTEFVRVSRLGLILRTARILAALPRDLTYGVLRRDRRQYPDVRNYLYEHSSGYLRSLGRLYAQYETLAEKSK